MAHELSLVDGKAEAAFAVNEEDGLQKPWHGLGVYCDKRMKPKEALEKAHLDWTAEKREIFYDVKTPTGIMEYPILDKRVITRSDNAEPLGVVGVGYTPFQNKEQAEFIEALVGEGAGTVECVGALFGGRRIFWTVKAPDQIVVNKSDAISKYLILSNAHDGTGAFRAFWSPIRVVCNNTLTAALQGCANGFSIRHTSNVKNRIEDAREVLGLSMAYYTQLADVFQGMADTQVTDERFKKFLGAVFPAPEKAGEGRAKTVNDNKRNEIRMMMRQKDYAGAKEAGNTLWGLYNAITFRTSHLTTDRGLAKADMDMKLSTKMDSLMFGGTREKMGMDAFRAAAGLVADAA